MISLTAVPFVHLSTAHRVANVFGPDLHVARRLLFPVVVGGATARGRESREAVFQN